LVSLSHFAIISAILLQGTQSFCYSQLSHFLIAIELSHSSCYNAQSFLLLQRSTIHRAIMLSHSSCYSAQPFLLLHCSAIPRCYIAQSLLAIVNSSVQYSTIYDFVSHSREYVSYFAIMLGHFAIVLSHFVTGSVILKIPSTIL
jgi:hypothetical protein